MTPPENHYGLESKQKLLETLQNEISVYEGKFEPLDKQFVLLEKYEKPVPEAVRKKNFRENLHFRFRYSSRLLRNVHNCPNVGNIIVNV